MSGPQMKPCSWPGCQKQTFASTWGCRDHWYALPGYIRRRIWLSLRDGQGMSETPSEEYLHALGAAQDWIKARPKAGA